MGSRQIVLVSTAGFSVLNTRIFWREAKTKRLFSQCSWFVCFSDDPPNSEKKNIQIFLRLMPKVVLVIFSGVKFAKSYSQ
jgi:hypothetical protein